MVAAPWLFPIQNGTVCADIGESEVGGLMANNRLKTQLDRVLIIFNIAVDSRGKRVAVYIIASCVYRLPWGVKNREK